MCCAGGLLAGLEKYVAGVATLGTLDFMSMHTAAPHTQHTEAYAVGVPAYHALLTAPQARLPGRVARRLDMHEDWTCPTATTFPPASATEHEPSTATATAGPPTFLLPASKPCASIAMPVSDSQQDLNHFFPRVRPPNAGILALAAPSASIEGSGVMVGGEFACPLRPA